MNSRILNFRTNTLCFWQQKVFYFLIVSFVSVRSLNFGKFSIVFFIWLFPRNSLTKRCPSNAKWAVVLTISHCLCLLHSHTDYLLIGSSNICNGWRSLDRGYSSRPKPCKFQNPVQNVYPVKNMHHVIQPNASFATADHFSLLCWLIEDSLLLLEGADFFCQNEGSSVGISVRLVLLYLAPGGQRLFKFWIDTAAHELVFCFVVAFFWVLPFLSRNLGEKVPYAAELGVCTHLIIGPQAQFLGQCTPPVPLSLVLNTAFPNLASFWKLCHTTCFDPWVQILTSSLFWSSWTFYPPPLLYVFVPSGCKLLHLDRCHQLSQSVGSVPPSYCTVSVQHDFR